MENHQLWVIGMHKVNQISRSRFQAPNKTWTVSIYKLLLIKTTFSLRRPPLITEAPSTSNPQTIQSPQHRTIRLLAKSLQVSINRSKCRGTIHRCAQLKATFSRQSLETPIAKLTRQHSTTTIQCKSLQHFTTVEKENKGLTHVHMIHQRTIICIRVLAKVRRTRQSPLETVQITEGE